MGRRSTYNVCCLDTIDPFTKRHELVHNGGFPKSEVLYFSRDTVKSMKIQ